MAENNKSQSPPSDTVEWRRENYDNTAFTRSKCYSCNNSPNTLVKLRSKHHYLYTEACLRWYVVEFILTKIKLFLSSPETNKQLQSKPVAEVRMYPRTCRVSSPRHLTAFTMSCTRGSWKLYGKLLFLCLFVCFFCCCCRLDQLSGIWLLQNVLHLSCSWGDPCFHLWW